MDTKARLEYLRGQLRAERISTDELLELQGLAEFIEPGDVELLEAANVPEHKEPTICTRFGNDVEIIAVTSVRVHRIEDGKQYDVNLCDLKANGGLGEIYDKIKEILK